MAQRSKQSTAAIQNLLDEKRQIERWLRRLDMATDKTPANVRAKVQTDYGRRLEAILEELQGYRGDLDAALRKHRDARDALQQQESDAEESLAEAELRHSVGEYDEGKWETIRAEITESLVKIREDLAGTQKEIGSLEEVLDAIDASPAGEPDEARPAPEPTVPAPAPELEDVEELAELEELPELEEAAASEASGGTSGRSEAFDEMAFLKAVISGDRSAESLTSKGTGTSGPRPAIGAGGARSADPRPGPSKGTDKKTVKCADCGTLNLPTEWYCENCGAELTAL
jgi:DNA repair exonuclease SbcCD ATPase subunit